MLPCTGGSKIDHSTCCHAPQLLPKQQKLTSTGCRRHCTEGACLLGRAATEGTLHHNGPRTVRECSYMRYDVVHRAQQPPWRHSCLVPMVYAYEANLLPHSAGRGQYASWPCSWCHCCQRRCVSWALAFPSAPPKEPRSAQPPPQSRGRRLSALTSRYIVALLHEGWLCRELLGLSADIYFRQLGPVSTRTKQAGKIPSLVPLSYLH